MTLMVPLGSAASNLHSSVPLPERKLISCPHDFVLWQRICDGGHYISPPATNVFGNAFALYHYHLWDVDELCASPSYYDTNMCAGLK